jgi:2-oxoglutarate/2-oxoacid ferredoxin oxidoreductase subunit beta
MSEKIVLKEDVGAFEFNHDIDMAWCPGCGNFPLRNIIVKALQELQVDPTQVVFSSGIGQAAKMPQYIDASYFNGLHGRAMAVASAIHAVNPNLLVIAEGGDGDMYGEGGNHLIHNIRRNPNIVHIVHDNMVYGLTKGQAAPTSPVGLVTPTQIDGVYNEPINPMALALAMGATFVARGFSGDQEKTKELIKAAAKHKGYAIIDIFHPCVTYNKVNTFAWYKNNTYWLDDAHEKANIEAAMKLALTTEKLACGILYQVDNVADYTSRNPFYKGNMTPFYQRKRDLNQVKELL